MDQSESLELFSDGKDAWNEWADANPDAEVDFSGVHFEYAVSFEGFHFPGKTNFRRAEFLGHADFNNAEFLDKADFRDTKFSRYTSFKEAIFANEVYFTKAEFSCGDAKFGRGDAKTYFTKTTFSGYANFEEAVFYGYASFSSITIESRVEFEDTEFHEIPDFHAAKNPERIALDTVEFALRKPAGILARFLRWPTGISGSDRATVIRIRQIRGIANANHAIDAERDLTILERNAQVGSACTGLKTLRPFKEWRYSFSTVFFSTPLLLLYRWSSDYGRSIKRPLLWLLASWFIWYVVYLKIYISTARPLSNSKLSALNDIARSGTFPVGTVLRPSYTAAIETLFGKGADLPSCFQNALLLQNVTSLIFLFLIGLALRNYFRMK